MACGVTVLAGVLIVWFGARGTSTLGDYGCPAEGCNFPPPVQILTVPVAVFLGCTAAVIALGGILPRLWAASTVGATLSLAGWWVVVNQLTPLHPPQPGWQFPVGTIAILLGGALALLASAYLGIMRALGRDRGPRVS